MEQSIATTFGLRTYKDVSIRVVDPNSVTLDSIELTFKDQYMGRSEMWRLKNSLVSKTARVYTYQSYTRIVLGQHVRLCKQKTRILRGHGEVPGVRNVGPRGTCGLWRHQ